MEGELAARQAADSRFLLTRLSINGQMASAGLAGGSANPAAGISDPRCAGLNPLLGHDNHSLGKGGVLVSPNGMNGASVFGRRNQIGR